MTVSQSAEPQSRRARKKARTRAAIFDAAMALFAEGGFEATTVEQICEAADVAKATFFLHFPTKSALRYEANARLTRQLRALLAEPGPSARDDLVRVTRWVVERWTAERRVMEPMFRDLLATPMGQLHAQPEHPEFAQLIVELVRRGQASGELRRDVMAEVVAISFVASCAMLVSVLVRAGGDADIAPFIEQYLELLLGGLSVR
jgi:AcrR family transcriptional regulator